MKVLEPYWAVVWALEKRLYENVKQSVVHFSNNLRSSKVYQWKVSEMDCELEL